MKSAISKKDKKIRGVSLIANIILWLFLLPSVFVAFGSIFASDSFGTGAHSKIFESLILLAIPLCLTLPTVILACAIASIVFRRQKNMHYLYGWRFHPLQW